MIISVTKEVYPDEHRVAAVPSTAAALIKAGHEVQIEQGAGTAAGYSDSEFEQKGARITADRKKLIASADALLMVRGPGADPQPERNGLESMRSEQVLIGFLNPLRELETVSTLAQKKLTAFAMELIPRSSRAQSMDALSSMASLAGYKAALLAADHLPKIFPLMMTAAGSLSPARVFVVGAGVAGLQACATAKRLGARVRAYDVRPEVKEQVQSVGAEFVEFDLPSMASEDRDGYAGEQSREFYRRQQEEMARVVAASDVVITTAGVPGKEAPRLITEEMVKGMMPRSVIVDVVADLGGNCELTEEGEIVVKHGVTIVGLSNLPSLLAHHASQMLARNIAGLFQHLTDSEGRWAINLMEDIAASAMVCQKGVIINNRLRKAMGLQPISCQSPDCSENLTNGGL